MWDPVHSAAGTTASISSLPPPPPAAAYSVPPQPATFPVAPIAPPAAAPASLASPVAEKPKGPGRGRRRNVVKAEPSFVDTEMPNADAPHQPPAAAAAASGSGRRNVVIKTKFPVARIKRIMQADEDVGKVAQVTPVVVSKALELFMVSLCDKASAQARLRNSKRITAGHLKQAVLNEEQFDFLEGIIEKVPDIPAPSEHAGHTNGGSGDSDEAPPPTKKPRKPRQKKIKDDDTF